MKENTTLSERLVQVIDYLGTNKNNFGRVLGYERSQIIYDLIDAKKKNDKPILPSFEFFEKFLNSEYSETISVDWLITGKGEMLKKKQDSDVLEDVSVEYGVNRIDKMLDILSSQQKTIESQSTTIQKLVEKKSGTNNNSNNDIADIA